MSRVRALLLTSLISFPALALFGCGTDSPTGPQDPITDLPRALSPSEALLVESGNDFTFRFLRELYLSAPSENLFASPFSASMALGMTLNGAAGETFEEMREMLGFSGMPLEEINQGYRDLMDLLSSLDPQVEMGVGNSVWYREGFSVRPEFLARTQDHFDARVQELDFADPAAVGIINGWVKSKTGGKIEEIIDEIDWASVMFLINATYFKARWTHRFQKKDTEDVDFFGESGGGAPLGRIPLMTLTDTLPYTETDLFQAVDIPYGGGAFSMTVILPRQGHSVSEVVSELDPQRWNEITTSMAETPGTLRLPRFKLEWERVLNETLKKMGMVAAFSPASADFSALSELSQSLGLFVSEVRQKSFVEVDEAGTEAAAATIVDIRLTAQPQEFNVRADRPFLFFLRERLSGTILFAGALMTPPGA